MRIGPFKDATQAVECAAQCRKWRRQIGGNRRTPNVERVQTRSSEVLITGDITFLVRSGIQCQWGENTRPALRQASSLRQHLHGWSQEQGLAEVKLEVEHELYRRPRVGRERVPRVCATGPAYPISRLPDMCVLELAHVAQYVLRCNMFLPHAAHSALSACCLRVEYALSLRRSLS
jgi:hypothetical protein